MSRTVQEGYGMYEELYKRGVAMVFFKEPHINTSTYQQAMENQLSVNFKTGDQASEELLAGIFGALNRYMLNLARRQIQLAFEQAEKENCFLVSFFCIIENFKSQDRNIY